MKKLLTISNAAAVAAFGAIAAVFVGAVGCDEPTILLMPEEVHVIVEERVIDTADDVLAYIPDAAFRAYCEGRMGEWDTDRNGALSPDEAATVKLIDMSHALGYKGRKVASMDGLEYFTGLVGLWCDGHRLKELDISANRALRVLLCSENPGRKAKFVVKSWFDGRKMPEGFACNFVLSTADSAVIEGSVADGDDGVKVEAEVSGGDSWKVGGKSVEMEFEKI